MHKNEWRPLFHVWVVKSLFVWLVKITGTVGPIPELLFYSHLLTYLDDKLCIQLGPRSGLMKCLAWSGSKLFGALMDFLKEFFFLKISFEKKICTQQKAYKITQHPEFQTNCIQIRPNIMPGLIQIQSVCKNYQQKTLVGKELNINVQLSSGI